MCLFQQISKVSGRAGSRRASFLLCFPNPLVRIRRGLGSQISKTLLEGLAPGLTFLFIGNATPDSGPAKGDCLPTVQCKLPEGADLTLGSVLMLLPLRPRRTERRFMNRAAEPGHRLPGTLLCLFFQHKVGTKKPKSFFADSRFWKTDEGRWHSEMPQSLLIPSAGRP